MEINVLSHIMGLLIEDARMVSSPMGSVINSKAVAIKHNFQVSLNKVQPSSYHFVTIHFIIKGAEIILSWQHICDSSTVKTLRSSTIEWIYTGLPIYE